MSVCSRADAGGAVDVDAHVALARQGRLARVHAHAHADVPARQCTLRLRCSSNRIGRPDENGEERVALRVDLLTAGLRERAPQNPAMLVENVGIPVPEPAQQRRRPLHVREQEGDRAGRKRRHEPSLGGRSSSFKQCL
jgi:hypothetical protein